MGGRALLFTHGQAHADAKYLYRDTVSAGSVCAFPRYTRGKPHAQPTGAAYPTGRGDFVALRGKSPRPGHAAGSGGHEFRIPGILSKTAHHRLPAAVARLHDTVSHTFSA